MSYLERKRNAIMSVQNTVRGYLRSTSGEPPLTLTDCYPDKMKIKLYGKSTQESGTYYTADHTITEAECNYTTRKLHFPPSGSGYTGNFYVFDGFQFYNFAMDTDCSEASSDFYIDCLREAIYEIDYNGVETLYTYVTVTTSSTALGGYTDFSGLINDRTGNVYLFGATPCSLGTVNGKYANFTPEINLVFGTKLLYDSYTPSLKYQRNKVYIKLYTSVGAGTYYLIYDGKFYRFTTTVYLDAELRYYLDTANCAFYRHSDVGDPTLLANADLLSSTPSGATELTVDDVVSSYDSITFTESATAAKKNWLTYPYVDTSKAENGVTWTDNGNGSITVSGTPTEFTMFTLCSSLVIPSGNYEVSLPTLENNNLLVSMTLNGTTTYYENPFSFTVTAATTITLKIRNSVNDIAIPTITFTVSLLSDSTILTAENVTSNTYPDTVHPQDITSPTAGGTVRGKNKFDGTASVNDARIAIVDGSTYASVGSAVSQYIEVNPLTSYALTTGRQSYYAWYTASKVCIIAAGWNDQTVKTSPANAKYIRFDYLISSISTVQLELGSTATPYSPYQSTDIVITKDGQPVKLYGLPVASDGNVTIGGQQYLSDVVTDNGDGTGTHEGKYIVVDMGTLTWQKSGSGTSAYFFCQGLPKKIATTNILCTAYQAKNLSVVSGTPTFIRGDTINTHVYIKDLNFEDAAILKSSLSGQYLLYELATPTTEPVTITKNKAIQGTTIITSDCPYIGAEYYSWEV